MKTVNKLFLILLSVALCAGFTSCGDDDDDNPVTPAPAAAVVGTYDGKIMMGETEVPDVQIVMDAYKDDSVKLKLNETISGFDINVECPSKVVAQDKGYAISGSVNATIPGFGTLPTTVAGTVDNAGKAIINITVTGIPAVPVFIVFTGNKK